MTNYHVIENAEEIRVVLADETSFTAEVLGQDQKTDIAVLKLIQAYKIDRCVIWRLG